MAWSHVQSTSVTQASGTTIAATYISNVSSGTKLIAIVGLSTNDITAPTVDSVKDGAGNSFTKRADQQQTNASGWLSLWDIDTPAGDVGTKPTITATNDAGATSFGESIIIMEVSGLATGNALDGTAATTSGTATTATTAAYTSSAANEFLLAIYGDNGSGLTVGNPTSGYTAEAANVNTSSNENIVAGYKNSGGGSESASWTNASVSGWGSILVAYKLPSGAAPAGRLQPWATVPVPRRRLARAVIQKITGQPPPAAPNKEPPPPPRPRPPRRAIVLSVIGRPPPAAPNKEPPPGPRPRPPRRAFVQHVTGSFPPAATLGTANREPFQPSRARQPQRAVTRSITGTSPAAVTRAYRQPPGLPSARRPARAVVLSVQPRPVIVAVAAPSGMRDRRPGYLKKRILLGILKVDLT